MRSCVGLDQMGGGACHLLDVDEYNVAFSSASSSDQTHYLCLAFTRAHIQMASTENTAAWLPGVGKPVEVRPAEIPVPGKGELLVEVSQVMPNPPKLLFRQPIV